jgi:hypothetical protein
VDQIEFSLGSSGGGGLCQRDNKLLGSVNACNFF